MTNKNISGGVIHKVPTDLNEVIASNKNVLELWESLTPLARNEWICWVENAKHLETRNKRIKRVASELSEGMRRPCCWIGCIHRTDKPLSPSIKGILEGRKNK